MRSVQSLNQAFEDIVTAHDIFKSFKTYSFEEIDVLKWNVTDYPLLYAQVTNATVEDGVTTFDYDVVVADLVIERMQPVLDEVYSDTLGLLQDVIALFENTLSLPTGATAPNLSDDFGLELPVSCQPFTARFDNLLTGWSTSLSIRVPNALNLCNVPVS
jgi:hypothetical protein